MCRATFAFVLLSALFCQSFAAADPPAPETAKPAPKVAYGDKPEFWDEYALVVAKVVNVKHHDEGENIVVTDLKLEVLESVPARYKPGAPFSLRFQVDIRTIPVRDKPGYAIAVDAGERLMLMITEEKGKLIQATPEIPGGIGLPFDFRGISSFAMLPSWRLSYPKEEDAPVAETVRVCKALSEQDATRRLAQIEAIRKDKPSDRVQDLLRRRLKATLESSLREAQEAMRLLKEEDTK